MKRNYIVKLAFIGLAAVSLQACQRSPKPDVQQQHQIKLDTSINYLLKPVNTRVVANIAVLQVSSEAKIYTREVQGRVAYDTRNRVSLSSRVSGRIEKLYISYNYQPVKKGQLIMEVYSPDLAAAQRELLMIQQSGNTEGMLQPARQRLMLLGMTANQVSTVLRTGKIAYRIPVYSQVNGFILETQAASSALSSVPATAAASSGSGMDNMGAAAASAASLPVSGPENQPLLLREGQYLNAGQNVFTIYKTGNLLAEFYLTPAVASQIKLGSKVLMQHEGQPEKSFSGTIGLIQPVLNAGENFVVARVYLQRSDLQPGALLVGQMPFVAEKGYWLPKEAVLSTGQQSLIFKKEGQVFVPKAVKTGISDGKVIQVLEEISTWEVAKNASYLIDSESFIKINKTGA